MKNTNSNYHRGRPTMRQEPTRAERLEFRLKRHEQFLCFHAKDLHELQLHCNRLQAWALDATAWMLDAWRAIGKDYLPKPPLAPSRPTTEEVAEDPPFDVTWEKEEG